MITCREIQEMEQLVFHSGVSAESLMEKVGQRMAQVILRDHREPGRVVAFLGKGHNAGDALVVLKYLQQAGWEISLRQGYEESELADLTRRKLAELSIPRTRDHLLVGPLLLLDGLLGVGTEGDLREPLLGLAREMNELRASSGARTIAMDLPSGLQGDTGGGGAVVADLTLTVGVPKRGLVADSATDFVGRLELIELAELPLPEIGDRLITEPQIQPRPFSFHKGQAGRVAIVAGSRGMLGAAVLASTGALKAGAGLITLWVEEAVMSDVLSMVPPEIMVRSLGSDWQKLAEAKPDAVVIGPGLGDRRDASLLKFLEANQLPIVLDADALNAIVRNERRDLLRSNVLVTPHPGEMARLHPLERSRAEIARSFAHDYEATLLFKGARTIVTKANHALHYNTTGTPGMATGGQGDLLAGVLGALLAGGRSLLDAASQGAWMCGRAAELALLAGESESSLTPSDVSRFLGRV